MAWWVYVPTWVLSAGSLLVAELGRRRAAESDERAAAADSAARDARAGHDTMEKSLEKIAEALQVQARRTPPTAGRGGPYETRGGGYPQVPFDLQASAASERRRAMTGGGPPDFNIEVVSRNKFRLRNVGTGPATNLRVDLGDFPDGLTRDVPDGIELEPFASSTFLVMSAMQAPRPGEVRVICDEIPDGVLVALPTIR